MGRAGLPACAFKGKFSGAPNRSKWRAVVLGTKSEHTYTHIYRPVFFCSGGHAFIHTRNTPIATIQHNIYLPIQNPSLHIADLCGHPDFVSSTNPWLIPLQPHRPPHCPANTPRTFLPQGLCTICSGAWNASSIDLSSSLALPLQALAQLTAVQHHLLSNIQHTPFSSPLPCSVFLA